MKKSVRMYDQNKQQVGKGVKTIPICHYKERKRKQILFFHHLNEYQQTSTFTTIRLLMYFFTYLYAVTTILTVPRVASAMAAIPTPQPFSSSSSSSLPLTTTTQQPSLSNREVFYRNRKLTTSNLSKLSMKEINLNMIKMLETNVDNIETTSTPFKPPMMFQQEIQSKPHSKSDNKIYNCSLKTMIFFTTKRNQLCTTAKNSKNHKKSEDLIKFSSTKRHSDTHNKYKLNNVWLKLGKSWQNFKQYRKTASKDIGKTFDTNSAKNNNVNRMKNHRAKSEQHIEHLKRVNYAVDKKQRESNNSNYMNGKVLLPLVNKMNVNRIETAKIRTREDPVTTIAVQPQNPKVISKRETQLSDSMLTQDFGYKHRFDVITNGTTIVAKQLQPAIANNSKKPKETNEFIDSSKLLTRTNKRNDSSQVGRGGSTENSNNQHSVTLSNRFSKTNDNNGIETMETIAHTMSSHSTTDNIGIAANKSDAIDVADDYANYVFNGSDNGNIENFNGFYKRTEITNLLRSEQQHIDFIDNDDDNHETTTIASVTMQIASTVSDETTSSHNDSCTNADISAGGELSITCHQENITCVGEIEYCNLTYEEYKQMLEEYIFPSVWEWILIGMHGTVFLIGLVSTFLFSLFVCPKKSPFNHILRGDTSKR